MTDDAMLLLAYARDRSEAAFAELVQRHIGFVYAAALRQVNGDAHLAQDVTQLVFTDLARKAKKIAGHRVLAGWLFTSTRFAAANVVRGESRRRAREEQAHLMKAHDGDNPGAILNWEEVRPVLDEVLAELAASDRDAILLRFFQGLDFAAVGARLELTDNAARMRVDRALERLRAGLAKRGITSTGVALGLALGSQAAVAAPAGLAAGITSTALAGVSTGAIAFMSTAKLQWSLAAAVVAAGTGVGLVQERVHQNLKAQLAAVPTAAVTMTQLREENHTLIEARKTAAALKVNDAEWTRLREEAAVLRDQAEQRERLARTARAAAVQRARQTALSVDQLDEKPQATIRTAPAYPAGLLEKKTSGSVLVEFVIDDTGQVADARVLKSSRREFEAPTLAALQQWRFSPGLKDGRQVNTRVTQMFEYQGTGLPAPEPPAWF